MSNDTKTCFVISPLGDDGSDVRINADRLFNLIIEPALEVFGFHVERADKVIGPGLITSDIIRLVQNSELCIIDLTDHNANVFYECGRRHETAKPYIQLIRAGEKLPFDVAGIRTIHYNLDSPEAVKKAIDEIRKPVRQFEDAGYVTSSSGVSTTTLAQGVERLERKLNNIETQISRRGGKVGSGGESLEGVFFSNPDETFMKAVAAGDLSTAEAALERVSKISGDKDKVVTYSSFLANAGSEFGASLVRANITSDADTPIRTFITGVHALVQFYIVQDREAEGVGEIESLINPRLEDGDLSSRDRARLKNQLQRIYYGAERYEDAQRMALEVVELEPDVLAYKYNLSLVYEARGLFDLAEGAVDEYMALQDDEMNSDHLGQAIDIYLQRGRNEEVRETFARLAQLDPAAAALKTMLDDQLKEVLAQ